jgi:sugar lactone lactonase YvrE
MRVWQAVVVGSTAALITLAATATPDARARLTAQSGTSTGSPGPMADTCGASATPVQTAAAPAARGTRVYPAGQYPIALPAVSLLGARNDLPNPYHAGIHWGTLPDHRVWGSVVGIDLAPDGTIWAADRCGRFGTGGRPCVDVPVDPIVQFDPSGTVLRSFGKGTIVTPHKLAVDREGNVWVTDIGTAPGIGQQVLKFNPRGQVMMRLGTAGVSGAGPHQFQQPTDVAIGRNGDIYVADGHANGGGDGGNARIVQFDRNGAFIRAWGRKGMGPGEFDMPHDLAIDSHDRLFVADRQNNRIQIFEADGRYVSTWYQFGRPSAIYIDATDTLYSADSESRDGRTNTGRTFLPPSGYGYNLGARRGIRIGSAKDGTVREFIPDPCPYPYPDVSSMTEGLAVDAQGTIYGSEYLGTIRKYRRN